MLLSLILWIGEAAAQESWTLTLDHEYELRTERDGVSMTVHDTASGVIELTVDRTGAVSGGGSVTLSSTSRTPGLTSSRATGAGRLTATGRSDDRYLYVTLHGLVEATGQTVYDDPILGVIPYSATLHGESLANALVIERKNGASVTSTNRFEPSVQYTIDFTTTFSLAGLDRSRGPAATEAKPPANAETWTLEHEMTCRDGERIVERVRGEAVFPVTSGYGPVQGEGPVAVELDLTPSGGWTGRLRMDGEIKREKLHFDLKYIAQHGSVEGWLEFSGQSAADAGPRISSEGREETLPLRNGAERTHEFTAGEWQCRLTNRLLVEQPTQVWELKLTGQETDDMGGATFYAKMNEVWRTVTVDYGVRFDYTIYGKFTLRKVRGEWRYDGGTILSAQVKWSDYFDPTFFVVNLVKAECTGCDRVTALAGQPLAGTLENGSVRFSFPRVIPSVVVPNRPRNPLPTDERSQQGWSNNLFMSEEFLDRVVETKVPLRNDRTPKLIPKKSAKDRSRLDSRPTISLSYFYLLHRVE